MKKNRLTLMKKIFFGFLFTLSACSMYQTDNKNDLPKYLKNQGVEIISFVIDDENRMKFNSVLCKNTNTCINRPMDIDLGDCSNNITNETKILLGLNENQSKLEKVNFGGVALIHDFPIYFSGQDMRDDYIGNGFIRDNGYAIDFNSKNIYINPEASLLSDFIMSADTLYTKSNINIVSPSYLTVQVSINGNTPVNFLIDNGASESLIDSNYANSIGLDIDKNRCEVGGSQIGKIELCRTIDVSSMKIDKNELKAPSKGFWSTNLSFVMPGDNIKGLLGMDLLLQNQAIIHPKEKSIYTRTVNYSL